MRPLPRAGVARRAGRVRADARPRRRVRGRRAASEKDAETRAGGRELRARTQAEEDTYTGKVIDLDPIVREQVLLALPAYPVCNEGCKGLCPVCGANLNERECGCDRHVPDPRWAGLKNVKL